MDKKKIVFVITKSEVGGAQSWVYELKQQLDKNYDIFLITSDNGWLATKFDSKSVFIIRSLSSMKNIMAIIKMAIFLRKINADVVISSSANAGIYARLSQIFYRCRHVYVSHGWSCIYNGGRFKFIFCLIERLLSLISYKVMCISENDRLNAIDIIGIDDKKIVCIRNGVSPMPFKHTVNRKKRVLFVGRFVHPKRPDLLLEVSSYFPHFDFLFVGDGKDRYFLESKYKNNNNVFFLGEIEGFSNFNDYDIFALCSDSEGLPMSALEAGSAGVPMLLSDVGGCSELIISDNDGRANGELFTNNVESLVGKIRNITDNYDSYFAMAQSVKGLFDISNVKQKYIDLIEGR
ncbi:glycosyltransferase [Edwardsiella piscicida]|uniref:glycosyltransferase n=1 Tax=Edwardsiella piscicida TaxID=1263550 RepID=UPI002478B312|nr:glycosyltransferase [Edwardsiella piscicida]ELM3735757.1 glycosyltransferase [Edwardsiella piscicida]WGS78170.1 glycosyltransferase [Edwardsiella piscicida]WGS81557.1 glycosyltransferase [Edwardsiella piscicida]